MGKKIKEAVEKLDALAADRHRFQLQEVVVRQPNQVDWRRQTGSLRDEPDHIYGRDEETEKIVDILVKEVVLKAIIESAAGARSNLENFDSLQRRVRQELNENRYLLIFDDVWNENQEDWVKLKSILACGSTGASVVVTTRLRKVADIMKTENDQHPNLETIGRRIVKKCGGVPLAAKALGEEVGDVGDQIWNELAVRSFFQEVCTKGRTTTFKMHDLVHDLPQSILENKIPGTQQGVSTSVRITRHAQWREIPKVSTSSIAVQVSSLTTIMNYTRLRTLKLNGARVK
ncbi:hypothetical protein ACS0TY_017908 [Phlomoides rotata]